MKKSVRYILFSLCAVLLITCGVLFALHKPSDNTPNNPGILTPEEGSEGQEETDSSTGSTIYIIHLVMPDGTVSDYDYYPAMKKFTPKAHEKWIEEQEVECKYYRFDGWYTDSNFQNKADAKTLSDGIRLYAHMVEQVIVTIHGFPREPETIQKIRADKNSFFDVDKNINQNKAQLVDIYSDAQMTQLCSKKLFINQATDLYPSWSTPYSDFKMTLQGVTYYIESYEGADTEVVVPSKYVKGSNSTSYKIDLRDYVFGENNNITSVKILEGIKTIGNYCFGYCPNLQSIEIPSSVRNFGYNVCYSCVSLTSVIISKGVTIIKEGFFSNCTSLTSIIIPDSVTSIAREAFYGCSSLASITILATTPPTLESGVINNIPTDYIIYVPAGSVSAYKTASYWSSYASHIQAIPES